MQLGDGSFRYEWIDNWARIPQTASGQANGRTHGVVVTQAGNVMVFNQADPAVLTFDADGKLIDSWGDRFAGAHGMTLVQEDGCECLWLTDQGTCEVVKTTLDGQTVMNIEKPDVPHYRNGGKYSPTWVAVAEEHFGGNGDIFVTDGYGSSVIHRFDRAGKHLNSFDGTAGQAGAFKCPHGIWVDWRRGGELYVADRGNHRVQVYDLEGNYKRVFGDDFLTSPCGFVTHGDLLLTPELRARLMILDGDDKPAAVLGDNADVCEIDGWPNHNVQGRPELIEAGKFNSPHGMAADPDGNLYIVEWIVGGRITKLAKC